MRPFTWLRVYVRTRRARREAVDRLYAAIVAQARSPYLFRELAVPDTREGRLEAVTLHALLVMRRLQPLGDEGRELGQDLFDHMVADVDQHLREWGVGDLSVGRHVKAVAQSFMARVDALDPMLRAGDPGPLAPVLRRNVYGEGAAVGDEAIAGLADYLLRQDRDLAGQTDRDLLEGRVRFTAAEPARRDAADAVDPQAIRS